MSLASKLIAAIVLLLVATVGAAGFFSARSIEAYGREEAARSRAEGEKAMKAQAELVARHLATSAGLPLAEGNFTYISSLAETTLKDDQRIEWLMISDATSDRVVAHAGGAPAVDTLADDLTGELKRATGAGVDKVIYRVDPKDHNRYVFGANVSVGERVVGQVRLALSTRELETALASSIAAAQARARDSARQLVLLAAGILFLGVLVGAYQGMRITRPLKSLARVAQQVSAGDFSQRAPVESGDEIGRLARTFNGMAENLGALLEEMTVKAQLERELELARSVQELMSPPPDPISVDDITLAGFCEAATQCGGDWWHYRQLSGGRVLIVIGDVTGHGMPAAMIAATARGAVEALAMMDDRDLTPTRVLDCIDGAIRDVGSAKLLMTCFALVLSPEQQVVDYANAGHTFPYIARVVDTGTLTDLSVLAVNGNPLGNPTKCVRTGSMPLLPGQLFVLCTDGLVDRIAANGDRYGDKRLRKLLQKSRFDAGGEVAAFAVRDLIIREVRAFAGAHPADDDTTLVVCKYRHGTAATLAASKRGAVA
jgi:sigma-B regulation protein RsbU (phosphoserine phosphatase)